MSPLRRRMIEEMQIRNLTTEHATCVTSRMSFGSPVTFRKSPDLLGPPEIRSYLLHLTRERRLAASSIIVTVSALRFFLHTVTLKRDWVVEDDIPAWPSGQEAAGRAEQGRSGAFPGCRG